MCVIRYYADRLVEGCQRLTLRISRTKYRPAPGTVIHVHHFLLMHILSQQNAQFPPWMIILLSTLYILYS